jgi:hypothetical protein
VRITYVSDSNLSVPHFYYNKLEIIFSLICKPIRIYYISDIPVIPSPTNVGVFGIDLIILGEIAIFDNF